MSLAETAGRGAPLPLPAGRPTSLVEAGLLLLVVAGFVQIAVFFYHWRYLPQPFIWSVGGTFADWFNTAYWAHNPGAFDNWRTVYPPLSFVFLRLFTNVACYGPDASMEYSRDCDLYGRFAIIAFYVIAVALTYVCYWKHDKRTAFLRGSTIALGLPLLYTLERGNLILPCFSFFVLAQGRLLKHAWAKWLCVAMTINFKPYLMLAVLPRAVRRRWRWLEGAGLATLFVYLVTFALEGAGNPVEMIQNLQNWTDFVGPQYWWNFFDSTTWSTIVTIIESPLRLRLYVGSRTLDTVALVIPILIHLGQAGVLASMAAAWLQPAAASMQRLAALSFSLVLTASNPGGYTELFLVFLVFFERWRGAGVSVAIVAAYLLSIPADHILVGIYGDTQQSWLGDRQVVTDFGVAVGQFVRPGLVLAIQYGLAATTVADFVRLRHTGLRDVGPRAVGAASAEA